MKKETIVINLISGPSSGKTTTAAEIFAELKKRKTNIEFVQEYAKHLVWTEKFEILNNQYQVSYEQFTIFKSLQGKVDFIITDGCLLHGLIYNITNPDNTSNIEKTHKNILKWYSEFTNINIFLKRDDNIPYEVEGRLENRNEARKIDDLLKLELEEQNIKHTDIQVSKINISDICDFILAEAEKI